MSAFGIRKPGQGYWVRVLSAVFWGAIIAAFASYGWKQASTYRIQVTSYNFSSPEIDPNMTQGDLVSMVRPAIVDDQPEIFGTAIVESINTSPDGSGTIVITNFSDEQAREFASDTSRLIEGDLEAPTSSTLLREASGSAITAFDQLYLQAGVAIVILLLGFIGLFITHASGEKTTDFLIATDGEMKKVHWSSRKEIQGSTIVVIVAAFLISGFLFMFDQGFSAIFRYFDVLQS